MVRRKPTRKKAGKVHPSQGGSDHQARQKPAPEGNCQIKEDNTNLMSCSDDEADIAVDVADSDNKMSEYNDSYWITKWMICSGPSSSIEAKN